MTAHATVVDFSTAQGYVADASLTGQQGWFGDSNWTVSDSSSAYVDMTATTLDNRTVFYGGASVDPSNGIYYQVEYSFDYSSIASVSANLNIAQLLLVTDATYGSNAVSFCLRYLTSGVFRIWLSGSTSALYSDTFSPSALGLDPDNGDYTSDDLLYTITMAKGTDADSWSVTMELKNLTTNSIVATISGLGSTTTDFYNSSTVYAGLKTGVNPSKGGLSEWTVNTVEIANVPESSSVMILLPVLALACAAYRKGRGLTRGVLRA